MEKWQDPKVIAFWIAIIILLVVTIMAFVIKIMHTGYKRMAEANVREAETKLEHQKKLLETTLHAQEKERTRIAADLHDSLIGKLSVIRLKSQTGTQAAELEAMLGESIAEARRISHDLTPPLLAYSPIEDLIDQIINPWKQKLNIHFYCDVRTENDLAAPVKIQLLRVVQELITNIDKHAAADKVTIHFRHTATAIALCVRDNGRGFDTREVKNGLGLNSLELRMQFLKARYKVKSGAGRGTATTIIAPF
jgi:two-component system NarL family sensor kinase